MDQLLGAYRPGLGGKKWWWPLFTNVINVAQVAAYKLYTYTTDALRPLSHIEFLSEVAEVMVRKDHIRPSIGIAGRHAPTSNQVRRDGINHKLISTIHFHTYCQKNCRLECQKRLHKKCSDLYHM